MTTSNSIDLSPSTSDALPLITITIPVLDEEEALDALYARLFALGDRMARRCRLEFLFTDNHSSDGTWARIRELALRDPRVRALRFSRNVGFQRSILANYLHARGDAILQIDADLQDPPEMLGTFLDHWERGYAVVYGVRKTRKEGPLITWFRRAGYWLIDRVSEYPIPRDAGDFRLIDRRVVQALRQYRSSDPYLRGIIAGMGFAQIGIPYDRDARIAGASKFTLAQVVRLGLTGVYNHSVVPLRLASYAGIVLLGVSLLGTLYYIGIKIVHPDLPQGLASIHILVLFGIGFQSLLLGILGEYLLRIYLIVRAEPLALIEESVNIPLDQLKL